MELKELLKTIEAENIEVKNDDSFIVLAKSGKELHIGYEGELDVMVNMFLTAAKTYKDFELLLCRVAQIHVQSKNE